MALRHRIRLGTDMTTELLDTDDLGQTEAALSFAYDSRVRLHVIGQHTPVRTRLSRLTVGTLAVDHAEFMTDVMYEIDPPPEASPLPRPGRKDRPSAGEPGDKQVVRSRRCRSSGRLRGTGFCRTDPTSSLRWPHPRPPGAQRSRR
jgi:hypothetical protein